MCDWTEVLSSWTTIRNAIMYTHKIRLCNELGVELVNSCLFSIRMIPAILSGGANSNFLNKSTLYSPTFRSNVMIFWNYYLIECICMLYFNNTPEVVWSFMERYLKACCFLLTFFCFETHVLSYTWCKLYVYIFKYHSSAYLYIMFNWLRTSGVATHMAWGEKVQRAVIVDYLKR